MKKKLLAGICICIITICKSQTIGDFRSIQTYCENWEDKHNWEQYNGTNWVAAEEFPGESYTPNYVTISDNSEINISYSVTEYPINNLCIQSQAKCNLLNVSIIIKDTLFINGIFNSMSSVGYFETNVCVINGIWNQNQAKTITIKEKLILQNAAISGNDILTLKVLGKIQSYSNSTISISNTTFECYGEATFSGKVDFIEITGEKLFYSDLLFKDCDLTIYDGETFECHSNLYFTNSTILNKASVSYNIHKSLYLENSVIMRYNDFFATFTINEHVIIPQHSTSTIESAELLITLHYKIYGTLKISDKKGVKTNFGDFIVYNTGFFENFGNDRLIIYGNLINYGTIQNGTNGIFILLGRQNKITGNISTPRLQIDGNYTNTDTLEIKSDFTGNGSITQEPNSLLIIQSYNSPIIFASATGNTVRYTKRANQISNAFAYYNLELAILEHELLLSRDIEIINNISFIKPCFINCLNYTIQLPNWNSNTIIGISDTKRGIILHNGTISIKSVDSLEIVQLPLFLSNNLSSFARIDIQNFDNMHKEFYITKLLAYASIDGETDALAYREFHVSQTYDIQSLSNYAKLTFYWHTNSELPGFERQACSILHFNENEWEQLNEYGNAELFYSEIYKISAYTHSFSPFTIGGFSSLLPITISEFKISEHTDNIVISWKTESEENYTTYVIEKSTNGTTFSEIYRTEALNNSQNYYTYYDNTYNNGIVYYRLVTIDVSKSKTYYDIIPFAISTPNNLFLITNNTLQVTIDDVKKIELYSIDLHLLETSNTNTIELPLYKGIWLLKIHTSHSTIYRKLF